jgi:TrmH family RNA methyltransferase
MASIGRVKIFYTDLARILQSSSVPAFACVMNGKPVYQYAQTKEVFIVIGNESNGISAEIQQLCQHQISIPKIGKAESLNAAIACGIVCDVFCAGR